MKRSYPPAHPRLQHGHLPKEPAQSVGSAIVRATSYYPNFSNYVAGSVNLAVGELVVKTTSSQGHRLWYLMRDAVTPESL